MRTPYFNELSAFEVGLAERFAKLREQRGSGNVFLVEHGLGRQAIGELQACVGRNLRYAGVNRADWLGTLLPLAVAITEVGYTYQGTGTDFWPKVSAALDADIQISERQEISRIFASLSDRFGFARPYQTDWTRLYGHIAWPIRNALAPIEIHRSLLAALRQVLSSGVSLRDDGSLYSELRNIAIGLRSKRLHDWLEDRDLALALCRRLLLGEEHQSWLDAAVANRIADDLRADPQARHSLYSARRLAGRERQTDLKQHGPSSFVLSVSDGTVQRLLVSAPPVSGYDRHAMLARFGAGAEIVVPAAPGRSMRLEAFLEGRMIDLGRPVSQPAEPLLTLTASTAPATEVGRFMEDMQPEISMTFAWDRSDGLLQSIAPGTAVPNGTVIVDLVWGEQADGEGPEVLPSWPGTTAFVLDPDDAGSRPRLKRLGIEAADTPLLEFGNAMGPPRPNDHVRSIVGLPLFCRASRTGLRISLDGIDGAGAHRVEMCAGEVIAFNLGAGLHQLTAQTGSESAQFGIDIAEDGATPEFGFDIEPATPKLDDLLSDCLSLTIQSPIALEDLVIRAALWRNGNSIGSIEGRIASVPTRVGPKSEFMRKLKEAALALPPEDFGPGFQLEVSLDGLGSCFWPLARSVRAYRLDESRASWISEDGVASTGFLSASMRTLLLQRLDEAPNEPASELTLLGPNLSDDDALSCFIVDAPPLILLGGGIRPGPLSLARSPEPRLTGSGLVEVSEAFVAWSCATPTNIIADRQRALVVDALELALVEQLCGPNWREIEERGDGLKGNILDALIAISFERKLAIGPGCPEIAPEETQILSGFLRNRLVSALPDPDSVVVEDVDIGAIDIAVEEAYEDLSEERQLRGLAAFENIGIYNEDETWRRALGDAITSIRRPRLSVLLLPESRWLHLSRLGYGVLTQDDVVDALANCHVDALRAPGARWLSRREMRTGLQLWLSPREMIATSGWREDLAKLLSDRQTARAIRYAALRLRGEMQGGAS